MPVNITINVTEGQETEETRVDLGDRPAKGRDLSAKYNELAAKYEELVRQMGDQIAPFPDAGIDGFLSHFIISFEFLRGDMAGRVLSLTMPPAYQTVARSAPFVYEGRSASHETAVPLPRDSTLPDSISEWDFVERPAEYFEQGKETVWMQILNLDARMETEELGPIRIILGETLKREYPDIFQPSLGVAQSLGKTGFPARLFFNPYAVIETQLGQFRAIHGTLAYGRITEFPPIGTPVTIRDAVPMELVSDVREHEALRDVDPTIEPPARIIALSHPIDMAMQIPGDEAFRIIERSIERAAHR